MWKIARYSGQSKRTYIRASGRGTTLAFVRRYRRRRVTSRRLLGIAQSNRAWRVKDLSLSERERRRIDEAEQRPILARLAEDERLLDDIESSGLALGPEDLRVVEVARKRVRLARLLCGLQHPSDERARAMADQKEVASILRPLPPAIRTSLMSTLVRSGTARTDTGALREWLTELGFDCAAAELRRLARVQLLMRARTCRRTRRVRRRRLRRTGSSKCRAGPEEEPPRLALPCEGEARPPAGAA